MAKKKSLPGTENHSPLFVQTATFKKFPVNNQIPKHPNI